VAGGGGETEYTASKVGQPALNSLNTMFTSAPASTQKTVAYLENTGQTVFASTIGVNQPGNTDHAMLDEDGYLSLNSGGDSKIEFDDSTTDDSSSTGFKLKNNGGTLHITTSVTAQGTLTAAGVACNGNLLLESGGEIRIGSNQISTADLSDSSSILNTSAGAQTKAGGLTISGTTRVGILEISDASHQAEVDSDGHLLFAIPTSTEYRFIIAGADSVVMSASSMSIAGQTVATQAYVTSTLTSAETAASTIGLVQASPLTLAQALTCNGNVTMGNASTDTLTCNATPTFNTDLNLSTSSDIVRNSINLWEEVTRMNRDYRLDVSLSATDFTSEGEVILFDTDDTFSVFEFNAATSTTTTLSAADLTTSAFSVLLSFQGFSSGGAGSSYLFDYASNGIHTNLKLFSSGIIGHNTHGGNDGVAPNTLDLATTASVHITGLPLPTMKMVIPAGGNAIQYKLKWGTMSLGTVTGTTGVYIKLVRIAGFR
jgi:hypothetical protein